MEYNAYIKLAEDGIKSTVGTIPGIVSISLVSSIDGMTIVGYSSDGSKTYELQSAYLFEVLNQGTKSVDLINGKATGLDDIMIRTDNYAYFVGHNPNSDIDLFGVVIRGS